MVRLGLIFGETRSLADGRADHQVSFALPDCKHPHKEFRLSLHVVRISEEPPKWLKGLSVPPFIVLATQHLSEVSKYQEPIYKWGKWRGCRFPSPGKWAAEPRIIANIISGDSNSVNLRTSWGPVELRGVRRWFPAPTLPMWYFPPRQRSGSGSPCARELRPSWAFSPCYSFQIIFFSIKRMALHIL